MSALIRVLLSQKELEIEPGQKGELVVTVQNLGEIVDQYSIEIDGLNPAWYTIPVSEVSLFPQDQDRVRISLHPPAGSESKAGNYDFNVRVTSREVPTERTSAQATLVILSVLTLELGLSPERKSTTKEGVFQVRLANPGNVDLTVDLEATDPEEGCLYRFEPRSVSIGAGQSKGVSLVVTPKRKPPSGEAKRYDFTVKATPRVAPTQAKVVVGQLEHRERKARLPRWSVPAAVITVLLLFCCVLSVAGFAIFGEDIEDIWRAIITGAGPTPTEVVLTTPMATSSPPPTGEPTDTPTPTATPTEPPVFAVTSVTASVDPPSFSGACPSIFNLSAIITVNGPGTVEYKWERSDGAIAPTESIDFAAAGSQTVTTSWSLGASYAGWQVVRIITPNEMVSNQANFTLTCTTPAEATVTLNTVASETGQVVETGGSGPSLYVGDTSGNVGSRGFMSFDISSLAGKTVTEAKLNLAGADVDGDPFTDLDGLWIGTTSYTWPPPYSPGASPMTERKYSLPGEIDITSFVAPKVSAGEPRFQVSLHFAAATDNGNDQDRLWWPSESHPTLIITYTD